MNLTEQQKKGQELYQSLIQKAWEDESFKEQLIQHPEATINDVTGVYVDGVKVEDQSNTDVVYLNIPAKPNLEELELTEKQLEEVSGGTTPACVVGGVWFFTTYGGAIISGLALGAVVYGATNQ